MWLSCMKTHLIWLIMGKMLGDKLDCSLINVINSLLKNAKIANLCEIDILGSKDPVEINLEKKKTFQLA